MDPINDQVCFTLDNGVTKFYDLLQLVEFYQLNAGSLPTRLMHYVVQVPVAEWNLHEHDAQTAYTVPVNTKILIQKVYDL